MPVQIEFLISFIAVCHIFWLVAMFFQRIKDETWRTVLQFKYKMIIISIRENNNSAVVSCRNQLPQGIGRYRCRGNSCRRKKYFQIDRRHWDR